MSRSVSGDSVHEEGGTAVSGAPGAFVVTAVAASAHFSSSLDGLCALGGELSAVMLFSYCSAGSVSPRLRHNTVASHNYIMIAALDSGNSVPMILADGLELHVHLI